MNSRIGFTLIELLIAIAIILLVAAIAIPRMDKAQVAARELSAVRSIQALQVAEVQYYSQFGKYADSIEALGPPASGEEGAHAADVLPAGLVTGKKDGYQFAVELTERGYAVHAEPLVPGQSGKRTFYSDQTQAIRANLGREPATSSSPVIR